MRPNTDRQCGACSILAALAIAAVLQGCSDLYFDRRETLTFHAGDARASNLAVQTIDPWPQASADRAIEGKGEPIQGAVERYRKNKVTPPESTSTSSAQYAPLSAQPVGAASTSGGQ